MNRLVTGIISCAALFTTMATLDAKEKQHIKVYTDVNGKGKQIVKLDANSYPSFVDHKINDRVVSLWIPAGCIVTLWEHVMFEGKQITIAGPRSVNLPKRWRNKSSSAVINYVGQGNVRSLINDNKDKFKDYDGAIKRVSHIYAASEGDETEGEDTDGYEDEEGEDDKESPWDEGFKIFLNQVLGEFFKQRARDTIQLGGYVSEKWSNVISPELKNLDEWRDEKGKAIAEKLKGEAKHADEKVNAWLKRKKLVK